jgi:hypothetical protein
MKKFLISLCLGIILSPCGQSLSAAPVPYSGKVAINGLNFQGDAPFTFALRDANGIVHWRNVAVIKATEDASALLVLLPAHWVLRIELPTPCSIPRPAGPSAKRRGRGC